MPRNPPGTVKREAPPGPTMTEAEFRVAMEQLAQDAARWRCLRVNGSVIFDELLENGGAPTGAGFQMAVDRRLGWVK